MSSPNSDGNVVTNDTKINVGLDSVMESQAAQLNLLLYQIYRPYFNGKNQSLFFLKFENRYHETRLDWDNFLHHNIRKLQMYSIQLKLEFYKLERTYDIDLLQFDIKLLNICPIQIWLNVSDSQCSTTNANLQVHSRNGMLLQVLCSIKSLEFLVIWISPNS